MNKFIFVRHGESQANAKKIVADETYHLTEKGINQARITGQELKGKGIKTIVCSPMIRAQQTAETIAGELGIPIGHIKIIDELHERRFGIHENKVRQHESPWYISHPGGQDGIEPQIDLIKRMQKALVKIKKIAAKELTLVVGHGCSGFYLLEIASGKNDFTDFKEVQLMNNADFIEVEL